jgi:hypothetical protein
MIQSFGKEGKGKSIYYGFGDISAHKLLLSTLAVDFCYSRLNRLVGKIVL